MLSANKQATLQRWENPRLAGRILELDGVRGLAILLVLLWHYVISVMPAPDHFWQKHLVSPLRLSWSGVDLFFVLSGFLIGGILLDAKKSKTYFRTFYLRRFYRIGPIYFLWLSLFFIGLAATRSGMLIGYHSIFNDRVPLWTYTVFIQNVFMAIRSTYGAEWLSVSWSLAVEEQFYLLLPFAIWRLQPRGLLRLVLISIVCGPAIRVCLYLSGSTYYGPYTLLPCRADALGLGVLVALLVRHEAAWNWLVANRTWLYASLLAILPIGAVLWSQLPSASLTKVGMGYTILDVPYALLLLLLIVKPVKVERSVFRCRLLVKLGTVAYAVYIFHQGVNCFYHAAAFGKEPSVRNWATLGVTTISLLTVLALVAVSWRYIEKPLIVRAHSRYRYEIEAS